MSEAVARGGSFIGYEYRDITVGREKEAMYADGYANFGWMLDDTSTSYIGLNNVTMKFKRDRKIRNKAELTRLQRQFDACAAEITRMEKSKASSASIVAFTVGLIGTAFMAGATFAFLSGLIVLCVVMAVPAFIGWILPCFLYNATYAKKEAKVTPIIDDKYDEIYEVCERANGLLGD